MSEFNTDVILPGDEVTAEDFLLAMTPAERADNLTAALQQIGVPSDENEITLALAEKVSSLEAAFLSLESERADIRQQLSDAATSGDKVRIQEIRARLRDLPIDLLVARLELQKAVLAYRQAKLTLARENRTLILERLPPAAAEVARAQIILDEHRAHHNHLNVIGAQFSEEIKNLTGDIHQLDGEIKALVESQLEEQV